MDLFSQVPTPTTTIAAPTAGPLAKHARVEITGAGSYAGLTGSVVWLWTRQDGTRYVDVALDAGYTVSVRVSGVRRL